MKTISLNIYSYNELSEQAKQRAITEHRNRGIYTNYIYEDAINSVEAFHEIFNTHITRSRANSSLINFSVSDIKPSILELKGLRLRKWLINNYGYALYKRKYYASIDGNNKVNHPCVVVRIHKK